MNRHIVYGLTEGKDVRYIGYTASHTSRQRTHARRHPEWSWLVLGAYPTREDGLEQETWWIKRLRYAGHQLTNANDGGGANVVGAPVSAITRSKLGRARKGKKNSPETRAKISASLRSPEARAKISTAAKNKIFTPEYRAKLSAAQTGKRHSPETRAKISRKHKGKPWTMARRLAHNKNHK